MSTEGPRDSSAIGLGLGASIVLGGLYLLAHWLVTREPGPLSEGSLAWIGERYDLGELRWVRHVTACVAVAVLAFPPRARDLGRELPLVVITATLAAIAIQALRVDESPLGLRAFLVFGVGVASVAARIQPRAALVASPLAMIVLAAGWPSPLAEQGLDAAGIRFIAERDVVLAALFGVSVGLTATVSAESRAIVERMSRRR